MDIGDVKAFRLLDMHRRKAHPVVRLFVLAGIAICAILTSPAFATKRVALVVGNSTYQNVPRLDNPKNDAVLLADTLRELGFSLIGNAAQLDLNKPDFDAVIQSFGNELQTAEVGLFYYAGHGVQVRGSNYLVPVTANPAKETDVDFQMVDVALVLRQMEGSSTKLNVVILDSCRNNPFGGRGLRSTSGGLAQMQAAEGTLISYATQPGNIARDGDDGHSPYSKALAQAVRKPGVDIFNVFNDVGLAVKVATHGEQQPWISSSPIAGAFYFAGERAPVVASGDARQNADDIVWQQLASSDDRNAIELFTLTYPSSSHIDAAKNKIASLSKNQKFSAVYSGALDHADSPTYFAFRGTAITREAPTGESASRFSLVADQEVRGLGQVGDKLDVSHVGETTWIKIATSDGNEAFVLRKDILTPAEMEEHRKNIADKQAFDDNFDRAEKASGILSSGAGVWYFGGACVNPVDGPLKINLGLALVGRRIFWSEGNTLLQATVFGKVVTYRAEPFKTISLNGAGSVKFYRFTPTNGGTTDTMGFKDNHLWFQKPDGTFGSLVKCGTLQQERYKISDMLDAWDEQSPGMVRYRAAKKQ